MSIHDSMSHYYSISDSDSIYESDTSSDDETVSDTTETGSDNETSPGDETVSLAGTIETLPLYAPDPPALPPRSIPICTHHHLTHTTLTKLLKTPRPAGYHSLPPCHHARCPSRATLLTISPLPSLHSHTLTIPYTVAYTALTSPCPFTTLSRSFNRTRITNILSSVPVHICPHFSLNSPMIARLFSLHTMLHINPRCCAPRARPSPFRCGECADLGFHTLFQWHSVERTANERVGCPHVEVQIVVTVGLGRLVEGEEDLEWVAHSVDKQDRKGTREGWTVWQTRVDGEIFWLPRLEGRECLKKEERRRARDGTRDAREGRHGRDREVGSNREGGRRPGVGRAGMEVQRQDGRPGGMAGGRANPERERRQQEPQRKKSKSYQEEFSVRAVVRQQGLEFCRNLVARTLRGNKQGEVIQ